MECIALKTRNESDRVALRGVRVRARLVGLGLRATVEQTFVNLESREIEAVYTFPLPDGAAVCGFDIITGERILTGEVEENDQAIQKYEAAVSEGDGAFLLEQNRPDIFTARVGNLKPRQAVTVRLSYVISPEAADRVLRLVFPTTIAPRYISTAGTDPLTAAIDGDALNPPHVLRVAYGLALELDVELGRSIKSISSPTHAIACTPTGTDGTARVTFAGGVAQMDRDVVIAVELAGDPEPTMLVSRDRPASSAPATPSATQAESFVAVTFMPEFDLSELEEPAPSDTVFVLDCSGSMQGESIEQATRALSLCLRSLRAGDRFNVCRFGSTFELMSPEPLAYDERTLAAALAYLQRGADLGGTEILPALEAVLRPRPAVGQLRQVVLLTDGQVSNEPAVLALARRMRATNRIFSFGIGSACSASLVRGLARATCGAAEFISGTEAIEEKVLRTFSRMASPMASDVALDWHGAQVQTLAELPPVFDGDALTVYACVAGPLPPAVTLRCKTPAGAKQWQVRAAAGLVHDEGVLATLWARRAIQSIEDTRPAVYGLATPTAGDRGAEEIVRLSKAFNLASTLTSFVAVEYRSEAERTSGAPAVRRIPVMLAHEWGAMGGAAGGPPMAAMAPILAMSAHMTVASPPSSPRKKRTLIDRLRGKNGAPAQATSFECRSMTPTDFLMDACPAPAGPSANVPTPADPLIALLSLQSASGDFAWSEVADEQLKSIAQPKVNAIKARAAAAASKDAVRIEHTLLVLVILESTHASRKALWKRSAAKAMRWLATAMGLPLKEVAAIVAA